MSSASELQGSPGDGKKICLDDIEKYRDPSALVHGLREIVRHVQDHLNQYPNFMMDQEVRQCHHFLNHFTQEIEKLIPVIGRLDFEDVPANGLRSCSRVRIRYLEGVTEETKEVKLRQLIIALVRLLTRTLPVLVEASLSLGEDEFDEMHSREMTKRALETFDMDDHQILMSRKVIGNTFEFSILLHSVFFMRLGLWFMEKSWKRRIINNHYLPQKECNRSFLEKVASAGPEEFAALVRAADWKLARMLSSTNAWIRNPSRVKSRLEKKKFKISCPTLYAIELDTEAVYLRSVETKQRVKVQSKSANNNDATNNNSTGEEKKSPHENDREMKRSSEVKFYTLRSERRGGDSSSNKRNEKSQRHDPRNQEKISHKMKSDGEEQKQLVKGPTGRCAFYSQKRVIESDPKSLRENEGKIVIYIHGGAFFGPRCSYFVDSFLRDWSNKLPGVTFIVPDYSYCPEVSFPVAWQEMLDLYTWLVTRSEAEKKLQITIDPSKIVLVGDSSGGLLSCSMMVMLNEINHHFQEKIAIPRQVVLLYPKTSTRLEVSPSLLLSSYEVLVNGFFLLQCGRAVLPIAKKDKKTNELYLISPSERKNLPSNWFYDPDYRMIDSPILSPLTYDRWSDLSQVKLSVVAVSLDPLFDDGIQLAKKWTGKVDLHIADNVCHAVNYFKLTTLAAWSFDERVLELVTSAVNSL